MPRSHPLSANATPVATRPAERVPDRVAAQLRALIDRRGLKPGERLPAERALALELAVSRVRPCARASLSWPARACWSAGSAAAPMCARRRR